MYLFLIFLLQKVELILHYAWNLHSNNDKAGLYFLTDQPYKNFDGFWKFESNITIIAKRSLSFTRYFRFHIAAHARINVFKMADFTKIWVLTNGKHKQLPYRLTHYGFNMCLWSYLASGSRRKVKRLQFFTSWTFCNLWWHKFPNFLNNWIYETLTDVDLVFGNYLSL